MGSAAAVTTDKHDLQCIYTAADHINQVVDTAALLCGD